MCFIVANKKNGIKSSHLHPKKSEQKKQQRTDECVKSAYWNVPLSQWHWQCVCLEHKRTNERMETNNAQLRCFCWFQHNWYKFWKHAHAVCVRWFRGILSHYFLLPPGSVNRCLCHCQRTLWKLNAKRKASQHFRQLILFKRLGAWHIRISNQTNNMHSHTHVLM